MRNKDEFSSYHPIVNFGFFAIVIGLTMLTTHPLFITISLIGSIAYYINLNGKKATAFMLKFAFVLFALTVLINPILAKGGRTVLFYFPWGNSATLESVLYGITAGGMMVAVITWFACLFECITSDKIMYLFGRLIPSLSLVISMILRFVPRFKSQFKTVWDLQKINAEAQTKTDKIKTAVRCFSAVISWSLENSIDVADSMKSRGFGSNKRTFYNVYLFRDRDKTAIIFLLCSGFLFVPGGISNAISWNFYPTISNNQNSLTFVILTVFFAVCIMPIIINKKECRKWKYSKLKI